MCTFLVRNHYIWWSGVEAEKDEWCHFKGLQKRYSFFTLAAKLRMFISALTSALPPAHCFFMVYSSWWKQLQTILYWETGIGSAISYYIAPVHTWFTLDGISIHWSLWSVFAKKNEEREEILYCNRRKVTNTDMPTLSQKRFMSFYSFCQNHSRGCTVAFVASLEVANVA